MNYESEITDALDRLIQYWDIPESDKPNLSFQHKFLKDRFASYNRCSNTIIFIEESCKHFNLTTMLFILCHEFAHYLNAENFKENYPNWKQMRRYPIHGKFFWLYLVKCHEALGMKCNFKKTKGLPISLIASSWKTEVN